MAMGLGMAIWGLGVIVWSLMEAWLEGWREGGDARAERFTARIPWGGRNVVAALLWPLTAAFYAAILLGLWLAPRRSGSEGDR